MTKVKLRESLKQTRIAMSPEDVRRKSHAIIGQLVQQIDWPNTRSIHLFEAIESLNEVKLAALVQLVRAQYPKINLYTSRKIGSEWKIVWLNTGIAAAHKSFDIVIVPMLGFDPSSLHRIGFGGGYYDKLLVLADLPRAKKIGVCYEQGKVDHIEPEAHDIPLDLIITETTIYSYPD
jgi:5,10-methenyltetrahydrofolate synthetase